MGLSAFSFTLMAYAMTPRKAFVKTETGKHRDLKKKVGRSPVFAFYLYKTQVSLVFEKRYKP